MKIKKLCIIFLFPLSIISFSACQQQQINPKYADFIETDLSRLEENKLYEGESLCGHTQDYHSIDTYLSGLSKSGKTDEDYIDDRGWGSEDFNIVDYVQYMDISKEDFADCINNVYYAEQQKADKNSEIMMGTYSADVIYSGDETLINNHFNQNLQTYFPGENEEQPAKNFFVTHGALVRYVGREKYHEYLKHVIGTKYDNIKNFTEYFKLDKSTVEELLKTAEAPDFYDLY